MISAHEALERLREGNRRFTERLGGRGIGSGPALPATLPAEQHPFAVVLGCSDARVPTEMVFDQGLGELFVIRVAGNIATPSVLGSIEYAASRLGIRLVVVLGHTRCGAVLATLEAMQQPAAGSSPNLGAIVEAVRPAVETLLDVGFGDDDDALAREAVRANVRASVRRIRRESDALARLMRDEGLLVVGAEYAIETGQVEFFEAEEAG